MKFAKVMFLHVSVHRGDYLGRYPFPRDQVHPLGPGTPPGTRYTPQDQVHLLDQVHPPGPGTPPRTRYTLPGTRYTPPRTRYTPPGTRYTPRPGTPRDQVYPLPDQVPPRDQVHPQKQCMLGDTGNKRVVRILLECILVLVKISQKT